MAVSQGDYPAEELSEDVLFDLRSAGRRRELLRYLDRQGGTATLSDATEALAIREGIELGAPSGTYEPVYVSLYQTHIPRMVDAGVVAFETDSHMISLTPLANSLLSYLNLKVREEQQSFLTRFLWPHLVKNDISAS